MRKQWTTNGNRDAGSSCLCDRGLHRYLQNFGGGGVWTPQTPPLGTPLTRWNAYGTPHADFGAFGFQRIIDIGRNFNKTVIMHVVFLVLVIRCTLAAQFVGGQNGRDYNAQWSGTYSYRSTAQSVLSCILGIWQAIALQKSTDLQGWAVMYRDTAMRRTLNFANWGDPCKPEGTDTEWRTSASDLYWLGGGEATKNMFFSC